MVSGRLSLPQSFSTPSLQAPARPSPGRQGVSSEARQTPDFKSSFAPEKQDLRSSRAERSRGSDVQAHSPRPGEYSSESRATDLEASESGRVSDSTSETKAADSSEASSKVQSDHEETPRSEDTGASVEDQSAETDSVDAEGTPDTEDADASASGQNDGEVPTKAEARVDPEQPVTTSAQRAVTASESNAKKTDEVAQGVSQGKNRTEGEGKGKQLEAAVEPLGTTGPRQKGAPDTQTKATETDSPAEQGAANAQRNGKSADGEADTARSTDRAASGQPQADAAQAQAETGARQDQSDSQARDDRRSAQGESSSGDRDSNGVTKGEAEQPVVGKADSLASAPAAKPEASSESVKAEPRAEAQRPAPEPAPARADAPAPDVAQAPKLAGPSVADRLSQVNLSASDRAVLQAQANADGVTNQAVARGMNAVLRQGGGALTMKLSPASLGEVRIEMSMQGGRVSLQFDVGNIAAYEAIRGQLGELKHSLEQRGMTVERIETHVSPALARSNQSENQSNQRGSDQSGQQAQDRHDAADGQSRGRADGEERRSAGASWDSAELEGGDVDFEQSLRLGLDAVA